MPKTQRRIHEGSRFCIYKVNKVLMFIIAFTIVINLSACGNQDGKTESAWNSIISTENNRSTPVEEETFNSDADKRVREMIGDYQYPDHPSEQLRNALVADANARELPVEISEIEEIIFDDKKCAQLKISFTGNNENMCVITFINSYINWETDPSLDDKPNPSFTLAFQDSDNSQDFITVLTSVIKYLSPDLSIEEAEHLAANQNVTISTDGYSMPLDIGGYQIQTRYTSPHIYLSVPDFEAELGVNIRAIKQLWYRAIDSEDCQELKTPEDYALLTKEYPYWDENAQPKILYADFIVKNMWHGQSYLHGETWVVIDVQSLTGEEYSLLLDTWHFFNPYEFGVGQQYTLYIAWGPRTGLTYAVQRSESAQFNSRGHSHPIDHFTDDWKDPVRRNEPEGEGTVYNVCFSLQSQGYGEQFAALEGQGIGEKQWPDDPAWEGYTFVGWYDNTDWEGEPYTRDTPIYQDTVLYAKWKYVGSGGIKPRACQGDLQGIDEGNRLSAGQTLTIATDGYNMNLESPRDQRFRWYPITWRLSDGTDGSFTADKPFQATLPLNGKGEMRLFITYLEEIYDGVDWQPTGQQCEVEEASFEID